MSSSLETGDEFCQSPQSGVATPLHKKEPAEVKHSDILCPPVSGHVLLGRGPRVHPGHAGEITSCGSIVSILT